jgi:hypothetical protein
MVIASQEEWGGRAVAGSSRPQGFIGVLAPMSSLGFAPFAGLGLVYDEGLVLVSAAVYQISFSFQQKRIIERLLQMPYEEAARSDSARVYTRRQIVSARLERTLGLGNRLVLQLAGCDGSGPREVALIAQRGDLDRIRRHLPALVGDAFDDDNL